MQMLDKSTVAKNTATNPVKLNITAEYIKYRLQANKHIG
jgi:hypothetical protein